MPVSGVGQFGAGDENAFGDHCDDQIAAARGLGSDEFLDPELTNHGHDRLDMTVRQRTNDAKGPGRRDKNLTLERAPDEIDHMVRQMGNVTDSLMGDGLSLADRPSEQMGDVGLTLVDPLGRSHMHGAASCCHAAIFKENTILSREKQDF